MNRVHRQGIYDLRFKVFCESEVLVHSDRETPFEASCTAMLRHQGGLGIPLRFVGAIHPILNRFHGWHGGHSELAMKTVCQSENL